MDFNAENCVKRIIGEIIEGKDKIKDNQAIWYSMTRLMFKNYPAIDVYNWVEKASEEASDEQWFEHKYPKDFFNENWVYPKEKKRVYKTNNKLRDLINTKIKITDIAKSYGLDTDKQGITTCPFHNDSSPSLHLDNKKNIFHCFGCGAKGDIITFFIKLNEMKGGNKKNDNFRKKERN